MVFSKGFTEEKIFEYSPEGASEAILQTKPYAKPQLQNRSVGCLPVWGMGWAPSSPSSTQYFFHKALCELSLKPQALAGVNGAVGLPGALAGDEGPPAVQLALAQGDHEQHRQEHAAHREQPEACDDAPVQGPNTPPTARTDTRREGRTAAVDEASQNPVDRHTHELYTKPRGAQIRTRRSTLLYPKLRAASPSTPLLLPLTTDAGPGRPNRTRRRPGETGSPGRMSFGGPRGQASCPSPPLPAPGPRPPAAPSSPLSAAGVKMSPAKCLEYQIRGDVSSLGNTRQPQRQLWSESCRFREDTVTS
ncbi:collagen alpha-1(VII) chain [Pan paniscus]|uniref:collagen alpha-1(VII) chain n=1 Tax=Pan paniscus TaxID=9597 RepID=UPI0024370D98|nr:collagen alpha-1(VII) chain [Pan paniscus]